MKFQHAEKKDNLATSPSILKRVLDESVVEFGVDEKGSHNTCPCVLLRKRAFSKNDC